MKNMTALHPIIGGDGPRQISYSPKQAAVATGLSEHRVRQLVREHKLRARYDGGRVLIEATSLEQFVAGLPRESQVDRPCAANGEW